MSERQEVIQALLELNCIPAGMELFPAANDDQWTLIKKVIRDSDYYLVILGGRYGSLGPEGLSYTEMEYKYALEMGKPVLGFVHSNPDDIPAGKSEKLDESRTKLGSFRELVQRKHCKFWKDASDLGGKVSRALVHLQNTSPAEGWVRASALENRPSADEELRLRKRIEELEATGQSTESLQIDTSELAQDEDLVTLSLDYKLKGDRSGTVRNGSIELTWNQVYSEFAPHLLKGLLNSRAHEVLNARLRKLVNDALQASNSTSIVDTAALPTQGFNNIMIQFRALGYLELSEGEGRFGPEIVWRLSPGGDLLMTQLLAQRRTPLSRKLGATLLNGFDVETNADAQIAS
jgi:hypothetical protein